MKCLGRLGKKYSIIVLFILGLSACDKDKTPPGEVTDLIARVGEEQVSLTWTEPPDEDLISIQIAEVGADKIYAQPSGLNGITIEDLTNGVNYEFAVVTVDEAGNKSNPVYTTATPTAPLEVTDPDQNDYEPSVYVQYLDGYVTLTPSATFEIDTLGYVHITLTFNRPLDISSALSEQTIYFEGADVSPGNLSFSQENFTLTFTSTETFSSFGESTESASYMIYTFDFVMIGDDTGDGAILDTNGIPLDGDEDGLSGGDFILGLTVYEQIQ